MKHVRNLSDSDLVSRLWSFYHVKPIDDLYDLAQELVHTRDWISDEIVINLLYDEAVDRHNKQAILSHLYSCNIELYRPVLEHLLADEDKYLFMSALQVLLRTGKDLESEFARLESLLQDRLDLAFNLKLVLKDLVG